jgi:trigger factor
VKVITEKLPKSLLALEIELDRDQVEKGLDRAARRISQKVAIPGFRKGKAPRFIVENYYGRGALIEEASDDLVNRSFREALEQEKIRPVGPASLEDMNFSEEPFRFRVTVPVPPTATLPDYRAIHEPLTVIDIDDALLDEAMNERRERHVVLRDLEEPRPARQGDQLTVQIESFVDGEPLERRTENTPIPDSTLVLEPGRLVAGLLEGLVGITIDEERELTVHMPADHANEKVRDREVLFRVTVKNIQERLVPEWDELPVLEEFDGTFDELREKTRTELQEAARATAERNTINTYIQHLVEQTTYDIPDTLIRQEAEEMLEEQGQQFQRYGITLDQMLQYRGQTRDQAIDELLGQGEERLKTSLALREVVHAEGLSITDDEIDDEVVRMVDTYKEEERELARNILSTQLRMTVANTVLNQKLRDRLLAIATGAAPEQASVDTPASEDGIEEPETVAEAGTRD